MWGDPGWRRQGVGRALLQVVFAQAGFHEMGSRRPLATNPALQILEMACELWSLGAWMYVRPFVC
jgi:GNAT superfamily N-acetyltransferase